MKKKHIILLIALLFSTHCIVAQKRRANPVKENFNTILQTDIKNQKKPPFTRKVPGLKADTIIRDTLFIAVDTTKRHIEYPTVNGITIGANVWDPIMRLTGQKYGGIGFSAEVSLWNRIFPYLELGFGSADNTPEEMNFTYKGKASLYGKLGAKYNFRFNYEPDNQILAGVNLGYSNFKYDITNVSLNSGYWGESETISILDQKSHALWAELLFSLRVKIAGNVSMGWSFIYHFLLTEKKLPDSSPWYIPGFGTRNNKVTGNFSVFYTIPVKSKLKSKETAKDAYTGEPLTD